MDDIEREALARHELHIGHPTHRPLSEGYELVGLRGEKALADAFGLAVDLVRRPNGDGGVDNILCLGGVFYKVDVKCARKAFNLIVEVGKVIRTTIYILASYSDADGQATLLGWQWGSVIAKAPTKDFGHGVINHFIPRVKLRKIDELKSRYAPLAQR